VKGAVDGALVEFRSVVDAVRCAIEVHDAIVERNAGVPVDRTRVLARQDWTRLTVSHPDG
jgi:class 3 adenylate cyclase